MQEIRLNAVKYNSGYQATFFGNFLGISFKNKA